MSKVPKHLEELFHDTLKDVYYAEKKILSAQCSVEDAERCDAARQDAEERSKVENKR